MHPHAQPPFTLRSKDAVLAIRAANQRKTQHSLQLLAETGSYVDPAEIRLPGERGYRDEGDDRVPGCGGRLFCFGFGRPRSAGRPVAVPSADGETASAASAGAGGGLATKLGLKSPAQKIEAALASLNARVESLDARAAAARAKAAELAKAPHRKQEALQALRRCKALEQQAETTRATLLAVEQQAEALSSSALQSEIVGALNSAMKKAKKASKGLSSKAEKASDDASDLQDLSSELQGLFGEMHAGQDLDEDHLLAELQDMVREQEHVDGVETPAAAVAAAAAAPAPQWPSAPTRRVAGGQLPSEGVSVINPAV